MKRFVYSLLPYSAAAVFMCLPLVAWGQDYTPLTEGGVPGLGDTPDNIEEYINILYVLSIGLASALAVVKIILAGVQYMTTDVVPNKADAKKDIMGALLGLVLILGAVTILNTINPNLTTFSVFDESRRLSVTVENTGSQSLGTPMRSKTITNTTTSQEIERYKNGCEARGEVPRTHESNGQKRIVCYAPQTNTMSSTETEKIRDQYPNVGDTYTEGNYGSEEHLEFVQKCKQDGGVLTESEDGNSIECRF